MKRAVVGLLCLTLAIGSLAGCGSGKAEAEAVVSTENQKEDEPDIDAAQPDEEDKADDAEPGEEADGQEEEKKEEKKEDEVQAEDLTMTTLKNSAGTVDYTSLEELNLEKGSHIAVVVKSTKTGFWSAVKKGMEQALEDLNEMMEYKGEDKIKLSFEGPTSETDVESQINIIDAVLSENPSVLCLAAIDMESCQAQLETAEENGIPVVVLDSGVVTGTVNAVCATDNKAAGAEAARKLSEAIGGTGQIAVMTHLESTETSVEREQGFREEITANHPYIKIVDTSHENEEESMKDMTARVLEENPDLTGYFCTNQMAGDEVLAGIKAAEREDIAVVSFDAGKTQVEALENGTVAGIIAQNPYGMGYATVVAAARAELGLANDAFINSGYQWIDAASLSDEKYANYLYE